MSPPTKDIRVTNWVTKNVKIGETFKTGGALAKDLNLTPEQAGKILVRKEGELVSVTRPVGGSYAYTRLS
ncbi:MAG: hypothetical protein Q8R70_03535 [Methanoregula sp.]|nr:hypothetical protein [Methanoregula sp.]